MIQFVGVGGAGIVAVPQHYAHKLLVCLKQRSISNTLKMPKLLLIYEFISCYNSSIQLHFFHGKLGSRGKRATIESRYPTYDTCWVCQCFHIQANSDMSYSMFTMYVGDRFAWLHTGGLGLQSPPRDVCGVQCSHRTLTARKSPTGPQSVVRKAQ